MRASPSLAVDPSTSLGRRVFTLLTRAHVPHVHSWSPGRSYARALLVNPSFASLRTGAALGELCCVIELEAFTTQFEAASMSKIAWLAHGPTMEALMPRVRLALERGRFVSSAPARSAAYLAEDDLALVAAATLASEKAPAGFHIVTGPQSLTHEQVVAVAREALVRVDAQPVDIELEHVPISKLEETLRKLGLSEADARAAWVTDSLLLRGDSPASNDTFARLTGLSPLTFRRHLQQARSELGSPLSTPRSRAVPTVRESQPVGALGVGA